MPRGAPVLLLGLAAARRKKQQTSKSSKRRERSLRKDLVARYKRRRKRRNQDRGLAADSDLRQLARAYLDTQRRLWTDFADQGLLPAPDDATLDSMVGDFKSRHWTGHVDPYTVDAFKQRGVTLAGIYARYSSENSQATSIEDQMVNALNYAHDNKLFVPWVYVFADYSVSGLDASRRGYSMYKQLLKSDKHSIGTTLIDDFTRASRDEIEWWRFAQSCRQLRKRLIGVSDGFDLAAPDWEIKLTLFALLSRLFLKGHREKMSRGQHGAARRRTCTGKLILGLTRRIVRDEAGDPVVRSTGGFKYRPAIDPSSSRWLLKLFELYVVKLWPVRKICRYFNEHRVEDWDGWTPRGIAQLLVNPAVIGVFIWNKYHPDMDLETGKPIKVRNPRSQWEVYYNPKVAIIPMEWWRAARRRAAETRAKSPLTGHRRTRNTEHPTTLFSGTLFCGYCEDSELKLNRSAGPDKAMACLNGPNNAKQCKLKSQKSTAIIETALLGFLLEHVLTDACLEKLLHDVNEHIRRKVRRPRGEPQVTEKQVASIKAKIKRYLRLIDRTKDDSAVDIYHQHISALNKELAPALATLTHRRAVNRVPVKPLNFDQLRGYLSEARKLLNEAMPTSALAIRALTGPITITQESNGKKRGARWIAHFRPNLLRFLAHWAKRSNMPDCVTLDALCAAIWLVPQEVQVPIEKTYKYEEIAPAVTALNAKNVSVPAIAAELKVCNHTVEHALFFARTGTPPKTRQSKRPRSAKSEKRLTFKDIAPIVAELHDVKRISLTEIARTRGWSRPMVGRAYTHAHPERAADAIARGRRIRSPLMLSDDQQEKIRRLWKEGKSSLNQIAKEVGRCSATVSRLTRNVKSRRSRGKHAPLGYAKHRRMREMITAGMKTSEITAEIGCATNTVYTERWRIRKQAKTAQNG
ncbi:MAG TPA: recombinase family protein [Pirellulales bacterium]|nr:recombinase family protein [Pirellulales bacterium]